LTPPEALGTKAIVQKPAVYAALFFCLLAAFALSEKPYLATAEVDFGSMLPPPPADGSAAQQNEIQAVLDMQRSLTPRRLVRIQADTAVSVFRLVEGIFGPHFTKDRFRFTGDFFDRVNQITADSINPIKEKYRRLRPFQVSAAIVTPPEIAAAAQTPAYPSGHATFGAEAALLLSRMVPEKEPELFARGWEYGKQRIASGVAYPSDWEAGQIGAVIMVEHLMKKPAFRADFDAARSEIRKGLALAPVGRPLPEFDTPRWQAEIRRYIMALTTEPRWERWFSST
jgi:acid phosphatase (class A)